MQPGDPGVPRWAPVASLGLAVSGLALSVYLAVEHFTAPGTLACPEGGAVNCSRVTTSEQSELFGVPVALLGVGFFVAMIAVCLPAAWRSHQPALRRGRVALAGLGVAFVVYLVYAELFLINAICLWCTAVHAVAIGLFAVVALATAALAPLDQGGTALSRAGRRGTR